MPKTKTSVTLDADKLSRARSLVDAASVSALLDLALDHLIAAELTRRDIEGYRRLPETDEEIAWAEMDRDNSDLDDDVDWAAEYGIQPRD